MSGSSANLSQQSRRPPVSGQCGRSVANRTADDHLLPDRSFDRMSRNRDDTDDYTQNGLNAYSRFWYCTLTSSHARRQTHEGISAVRTRTRACFNALRPVEHTVLSAAGFVEARLPPKPP